MRELAFSAADLAAWHAGDQAPIRRALPGDLANDLGPVLARTHAAPVFTLTLELWRGDAYELVRGSVGPALELVVGVPSAEGGAMMLIGTPSMLPRALADLVDLGPRPFPANSTPARIPRLLIDAYCGVGGCPAAMVDELHRALPDPAAREPFDALCDPGALRWVLTLDANVGDDSPTPRLEVVDAGDRGLWLLDSDDAPARSTAVPITSTFAWRLLCGVLSAGADQSSA